MLDNETKRRIDTARDILVGKVPDPKSQVEQITIALIYKFMDDMDAESEELGGKRKFFSGDYERYGWKKLMAPSLGGFEVLNLYAEAIQKMNINPNIPQLFRNIFKNAYLPYRDPETLKSFLKIIDDFEYDHSERLGDAFEYLLSVLGSQGDAGQFRTPRHIIDFMVEIIAPKKNETILDPACGTAGFLISSYKHIIKHNSSNFIPEVEKESFELEAPSVAELTSSSIAKYKGDKLTPDERKNLSQNIKGYDISPDMVRLSLVNLYLHGFNDPKIYEYDTLTSEDNWNEYGDVILANPPFMSPKGGIKPHKRFSIPSNRSEVLFVDYMIEHLTPNGRAAIIVPEGIIFQSGTAYKQLRKMLVENYLFAVVSLPAGVFNPYSGVKTSILLIDKALNKKTNNILFAKIENDGFDLGAQRRPNKKSELPYIVKAIKNYVNSVISGVDFNLDGYNSLVVAEKKKIAENEDWNLSGERYKEKNDRGESHYNVVKLSEICDVRDGTHDSPKYQENGYPLITSKNIKQGKIDFSDVNFISKEDLDKINQRSLVDDGDIIMPMIGTIGNPIIVKKDRDFGIKNVALIKFYENSKVDSYYLRSILASEYFQREFENLSSGSTQKFISLGFIRDLQIPLPPLDIQKEIVSEIEGYQKIIDGARQVVENYKPQIQIDPSWPITNLGDISYIISGQSPEGKYYNNEETGMPFYQGKTEFGDIYIGEPKMWTTQVTKIADDGDIVMSVRAPVGPVNLVSQKCCIGRGLAAIKASDKIHKLFLFNYLTSIESQIKGGGGSVFDSITRQQIANIKIPLPDLTIQEEIVSKIEKERNAIGSNKELIIIFEQKIKNKITRVWGE